MGDYIETDTADDSDDIELDKMTIDDAVEEVLSDNEKHRAYTKLRRDIEDRLEAKRLKDELGIYDDYLFN